MKPLTGSHPPAPVPGALRARLRDGTAEQHERLDRGLAYLLDERLTHARYADLIAALFGFYMPLEGQLAHWDSMESLGLPQIERAGLLGRDLVALGRSPDRVVRCAAPPMLTGTDHATGALYVVEGACLGGRVIARAVTAHLAIGKEDGVAFFTGEEAGTGARWRQVLAWLDGRNLDSAAPEQIVEGARRTYAALLDWLNVQKVLA